MAAASVAAGLRQARGCDGFRCGRADVAFAVPSPPVWVGNQLELSAPGRHEIDPALPCVRSDARRRVAEDGDTALAQELDGGIEIGDVQRNVVAAYVAVAGDLEMLVGSGVFEHFEDRIGPTSEETDDACDGAWMHVEVVAHPLPVIIFDRAERVEVFAVRCPAP
jgi:hypothetical protein